MENNRAQNYEGVVNTVTTLFQHRYNRSPAWARTNGEADVTARRPRTREELDVERRVLSATSALRRENDDHGEVSPFEMAQMIQHIRDLMQQIKEEQKRNELPQQSAQQGSAGNVCLENPSREQRKIQAILHRIKRFSSADVETEPIDKNVVMLRLHTIKGSIQRAAADAKKYGHALPLADVLLSNLCDAFNDLADAINPTEELPPIPKEEMPKDMRVQFVSQSQSMIRAVIVKTWIGTKDLLEKLVRELTPQKETLMKLLPVPKCFQNPSQESKFLLPLFEPGEEGISGDSSLERNPDGSGPSSSA